MSGRIFWKLLLVAAVTLWAGLHLFPIKDTPFETFIETRSTAHQEQFVKFLDEAKARVEQGDYRTLYQAIGTIANERKLDLHGTFFPDIHLVHTANVQKRNDILMRVLLSHSQSKLRLGLDLSGGIAFTLKVADQALEGKTLAQRKSQLEQVVAIMRDRVNAFGVTEPEIRPKGDDAVEVQLPDLSTREDPEALNKLKKPARLEFREVHRKLFPKNTPRADWPIGYEAMTLQREDHKTGEIDETQVFVKKVPLATGKILRRASPMTNDFGGYEISMDFTDEGSEVFANITGKIADENRETGTIGQMAVVLDGKLYSAPTVREEIRGGGARITGNFTRLEAIELSNVLNNPLEVPLEISEMYEVGPKLAADARTSSIEAGYLGAGLVLLFMILYYRSAGLMAVITLGANIFTVLGILASIGATITLPGVAALVLTIGMAVDANILIFERIREEVRSGKRMATALENGFEKAFSTIVDANVTTLITACILIWLGTGPVKGFGVTLAIGIGTTVFTALILTRALLEILVALGMERLFRASSSDTTIPFQAYRKPAFASSWSIVLCGVIALIYVGKHAYGIDFRGGEEVTISYMQPLEVEAIESVAREHQLGEVLPTYQTMLGDNSIHVLKIQTETGNGKSLFEALKQAYPEAGLEWGGENTIGASVSDAITMNAFLSVGVALLGILLYIALRFEVGYGVGAVVATVHDVLMTIGLYIILGQFLGIGSGQFSAPMVAAILMIVGYSINDTIVVFDRIREELQLNPDMRLFNVINLAINRTLSRTLLTSLTTLLAALALYIFGAGVVTDYALVFILGVLTGTFSSIFIASPVFYWWHKGDRRHVEEREFLPKYDWETGAKA